MPTESSSILLLKAHEISALLKEKEHEVIRIVKAAYLAQAAGASSLPQSTFLRFPNDDLNRIIALPAYLGGDFDIAGIKWISSFPGNHELGLDRASAVIVTNSTRTGRPQSILEGATISAKRTAASAALAATYLCRSEPAGAVGIIGCGLINFEIVRFLKAVFPGIDRLVVFDSLPDQARRFRERCQKSFSPLKVTIADDGQQVLRDCPLISLATTAVKPHLFDVSPCIPGTTILHVSLRDLSPEIILSSDNVVDDIDHVCRANTSVHLAEQAVANRNFIRCTLADIVNGLAAAPNHDHPLTIFSPFGLGVLDLAVSAYVQEEARKQGAGMVIESFF